MHITGVVEDRLKTSWMLTHSHGRTCLCTYMYIHCSTVSYYPISRYHRLCTVSRYDGIVITPCPVDRIYVAICTVTLIHFKNECPISAMHKTMSILKQWRSKGSTMFPRQIQNIEHNASRCKQQTTETKPAK